MSSVKGYSSSLKWDLDKEFMYDKYKYLRKENSPVYGAASPEEVVIRPLYFDELCYLLSTAGTHLILFGGPWCVHTAGVIDYINYYARKYGVDTVYNFDFRMDGERREASVLEDLTAQPSYEGTDKAEVPVPGAENNYLYGELVDCFLTNLNDWTAHKIGSKQDIVYLNRYEEQTAVPRLQVPFLFLYNKDNKVDHSGAGRKSKTGTYPIVYAFEKQFFRDEADGKLYSDAEKHNETTLVTDYDQQLEAAIFCHITEDGLELTPYTHSDYIRDAYRQNRRGHAFKTENAFEEGELINIQMVTYSQLNWILEQKGTFLILFGGAWCANTQAAMATINDYAVANDVKVYMFDTRLDGKYPIDFWRYPRWRELQIRSDKSLLKKLYVDMVEKRLPNLSAILDFMGHDAPIIGYTDDEGTEHKVGRLQAPHFLAYNKENIDDRGNARPILAYCERMYELINCKKSFIYSEPNLKDYRAGTYKVIYTYAVKEGFKAKEIAVDRTAPIVPGEPVRNEEVPDHPERPEGPGKRPVLRGNALLSENCECC